MSVTWTFAVAATFAAVAVGAAPQAAAVAPVMSGHYIATATFDTGGQPDNFDLYVTPCGDGCANVALGAPSNPPVQAQLVNGLWTLDTIDAQNCPDGTSVPAALDQFWVWDSNTLAGTERVTNKIAACGNAQGTHWTSKLQLQQAT
jgi:hypothetical protein